MSQYGNKIIKLSRLCRWNDE